MRKKNFGDPPYPPKKAYFGRTKAKMGRFSQKGLCYSFEILHVLFTHKRIGFRWKKHFGDPPYPPKKAYFGRTKAKIGRFSQKGLCYNFEILHGLLTNKNIRIPMRKNSGTPLAPQKSRFWADKSRNGPFLPEGFVLQFWNFTGAPK